MNKVVLLFLDDDPARVPMLPRNVELHYVRTPTEFFNWLKENGTPDIISFDHDLASEHYQIGYTAEEYKNFGNTGYDCAKWAVENNFIPSRVLVHSWNFVGAKRIFNVISDGCAGRDIDFVVRPFNPYKPHLWKE